MKNRDITPEMARDELERRAAAKAELQRRQFDNSLAGSLSKIPDQAIGAAIDFPEKLWGLAKEIPGAVKKVVTHPIEAGQDIVGGIARGSQRLGATGLELGEYLTRKSAEKLSGNKIPKWNAREFAGLEGNNQVDLGKMIESKNPNALLSGLGQYGMGGSLGGTKFWPMIAANAATGAIQAEPGQRLKGGVEGAINTALPVGIAKTVNALRPSNLLSPEKMGRLAHKKLLKDIDIEKAFPTVEAANRLGLSYITPAEATGNPLVAAIEGRIGRTPQGAKLLHEKTQERLASERNAINNFLETTGNQTSRTQSKKLYKESYTSSAPSEFIQSLKESPIIEQAFKRVKGDPIYKQELSDIPETNFKYLDRVKQTLDDMHQIELRKGNKNKARLINEQIKSMTKEMDKINPIYKQARQYAQRNILREQIEKKIPNEEIRGSDFYRTFLANQHKYDKLFKSLKNVPEAQQQLADMRLSFKDLANPTSVRTIKGMSEKSTSANRNMKDVVIDAIQRLEGGNYDKAMIDLMTDPNWIKKVNNPNYKEGIMAKLSKELSRYTGLTKL